MNTKYLSALGEARPFFLSNQMLSAEFSNALKIGDHAILGFTPLIQMLQPVAKNAVICFGVRYLLAVPVSIYSTGFLFEAIVISATKEWLLFLVNARQRRQFMPQGAISFGEIVFAFVGLFDFMTLPA